jgi:dihydroflavonol-4-reductase
MMWEWAVGGVPPSPVAFIPRLRGRGSGLRRLGRGCPVRPIRLDRSGPFWFDTADQGPPGGAGMEADRGYWRGRSVCVTGGTGLLGFQLVRALVGLGAKVRVLALPPHPKHAIHGFPEVEATYGDVRDVTVVRRGLAGAEVVFHTAAVVGDWGPALPRMHDVHVNGTRLVLGVARERQAKVVHTSSIVTIGASGEPSPLDEGSKFNLARIGVDYVHAKRASEQAALEAAGRGQDVIVVNPAFLIGPEDFERSVMGQFCKRFWRGQVVFAPPGGFNLVDVRDVATGHLLAAERGEAGRRYILGGEDRTFPELMGLLGEVGGLNPRAVPVLPWWALSLMAGATELRARCNGRQPYPSRQQAELHRYYWFYRSDRARRELGYQARPLAECLADTYRWFSQRSKLIVRGPSKWWMRPGQARAA